jgi:hypothetical protein
MNKPLFVYYYKDTGTAVATINRDNFVGVLLFTCPLDWCPKNQFDFIQAAKFYGVQEPHRMKYIDDSDNVPF